MSPSKWIRSIIPFKEKKKKIRLMSRFCNVLYYFEGIIIACIKYQENILKIKRAVVDMLYYVFDIIVIT